MSQTKPIAKSRLSFSTDDGITLAADAFGDPRQPAVILSHGGGQTRHSWKSTGEQLARQGWYVVAYDHRGHGDSGWSRSGSYSVDQFADDQKAVARHFDNPPVLVGASLGGISCMLCQGESEQNLFSAVVFVDITPQMNHQAGRKILEFMSGNLSDGFASLEAAADVIAAYTGRKKKLNPEGLKKNLRLCDDGNWRWHWDPEFVNLRFGEDASPARLIAATQAIDVPMLLIRGHLSEIVTDQIAEEFLRVVPQSEYADVANAHHMVVGDQNDVFLAEVENFLSRLH